MALRRQHNNAFSNFYLALSSFPSLVLSLFHSSFHPSTPCPPRPSPLSPLPLPLPLFPLGQQCGSSVVSIIIVQSALLSRRNCQPSTNTGRAINTIFLSFPLLSSPLLSSPLLSSPCFPSLCELIHVLLSLYFLFPYRHFPICSASSLTPLFPMFPFLPFPLSSILGSSSIFPSPPSPFF